MTALSATATASAGIGAIRSAVAYLAFDLQRALRNRRYLSLAVAFPLVFYLLYTGVLQGRDAKPDPTWPAFFMVSMAAYGMIGAALSNAMPIAQERAGGWTRQLRITPLPSTAWVATKLAVAYLTALPSLVLVAAAAIILNHVSLAPSTWLAIMVSLGLGVLPFAALGLLIGFVFDTSTAQGVTMISLIGMAIVGGLWAPVSTFPDTLATIARIMPTYHFANLGWASLAGGLPDPGDVAVVAAYAVAGFALVAWRYRAAEQRARG